MKIQTENFFRSLNSTRLVVSMLASISLKFDFRRNFHFFVVVLLLLLPSYEPDSHVNV
jgi:hypothetical protein